MATQTLTVIARIKASAGKEREVRDLLLDLVEETSAEPGCVNYDLHRSGDDEGLFLIYENWQSREAWEAHMKTAHLLDFREKAPELLAEPIDVSLWKMLC